MIKEIFKKKKELQEEKEVSIEMNYVDRIIVSEILDLIMIGKSYFIISNDKIDEYKEFIDKVREIKKNNKDFGVELNKIRNGFIVELNDEYVDYILKKATTGFLSNKERAEVIKNFKDSREKEIKRLKEYIIYNIKNDRKKLKFAIYNNCSDENLVSIKKNRSNISSYSVKAFGVTLEEMNNCCMEISKTGYMVKDINLLGIIGNRNALMIGVNIEV